jgi:hypothetical protein
VADTLTEAEAATDADCVLDGEKVGESDFDCVLDGE